MATYIEEMQGRYRAPTIKQHLAAIRRLFDWLVTGQVLPTNPATSVRGPTHVVRTGKTSPARTVAAPHAPLPAAGQANASQVDPPGLTVSVSVSPLQHLIIEVLRRPVEFTQYLSMRYTDRLAEAGIAPSVGSRGNAYDNALAESVIGLFKTEVIRRQGRGGIWTWWNSPR